MEKFKGNTIIREEIEGNIKKHGRNWETWKTRENFLRVNFGDQNSFPKASIFQNCSPRYLGEKGEIFTPGVDSNEALKFKFLLCEQKIDF